MYRRRRVVLIVAVLAFQQLNRPNVSLAAWRQQQLMKACNRLGLLSEKRHSLSSKFGVVEEPPFVYCCLPKVACSSWRVALSGIVDRHKTSIAFPKKIRATLVKTNNYTQRQMLLEKYYKFMFVRQPLERLISAYRNLCFDQGWYWAPYCGGKRKQNASSTTGNNAKYNSKN